MLHLESEDEEANFAFKMKNFLVSYKILILKKSFHSSFYNKYSRNLRTNITGEARRAGESLGLLETSRWLIGNK